jgi:GntR family transcriptional regulator
MARPGDGRPTAARRLDRNSPMPLWAQLRDDLRRRMAAGGFGETFPGELALVAEYQVSRHTVRSALRELRARGIVVAERGRRPRLAGQTAITQPIGALYSLFASVEAAGLRQTSIVRSRDLRADGVIADRLGLEASTPLFCLQRLRLAADEPLALDTVWLPAQIAAPLLEADFTHTALYEELAGRTGVRLDGGHEHIRAVVPTGAEQRLLGIGPSTGALAIDRLGHAGGRPVEWRHTLIRGDRFSLLAEFSPRTGYQLNLGGAYPAGARPPPLPAAAAAGPASAPAGVT